MSKWVKLVPLTFLGAALAITLGHLRHLYLSKYFGYHDVALINDFLASLFHQGRVFRVFDVNVNHLAWHFTPSLFLVTPLYALFSSQFLLLAWSTLAAFAGYAILVVLGDGLLVRTGASTLERLFAGLVLAALMGLGPFPWRVATSGHFEHLFIFWSALMLLALIRECRLPWVLAPFILALGMREDAGLFVASQLAALLFIPRGFIGDRRRFVRRLLALACVAVAWTGATVKLIFPAFGMNENWHAQRLWGDLGQTFGQVALNLLLHPSLLIHAIRTSAFVELNRSLLWLPWLNPPLALAVNAPGALFYTTLSVDRKQLLYYTSAMLLPGLFLAVTIGLTLLARWLRPRHLAVPVLALLLLPAIFTSRFLDRIHDEDRASPQEFSEQIAFISEALHGCPAVHSIASDFRTSVFLPNGVMKFLLWNYGRADAVIYASQGARFTPGLPPESARQPDFSDFSLALATLARDREFHLVGEGHGLLFLVRSGIPCGETLPAPSGADEGWQR